VLGINQPERLLDDGISVLSWDLFIKELLPTLQKNG
jgi:hypothetical protein